MQKEILFYWTKHRYVDNLFRLEQISHKKEHKCLNVLFVILWSYQNLHIFLLKFSLSVLESKQLNNTCRCGVEGTSKKKSGSNRIINGKEINPVRI